MNRKYILNEIVKFVNIEFRGFESSIIHDTVVFIKDENKYLYKIHLRCQNFGEIYIINTVGNIFQNKLLENDFQKLLFPELLNYYNKETTILISSKNLGIGLGIIDYHIKSYIDIDQFCMKLKDYINQLELIFIASMQDPIFISNYLAQFPYNDNLKSNVGSKFPVENLKKIFLLFIGGQMERYQEYKTGLEAQLISLPERKPEKKEEAKMYLDNFYYLIEKLESGKYLLNNI